MDSLNRAAVVIRDNFPVSPEYSLIIPKLYVRSSFHVSGDEHHQAWTASARQLRDLRAEGHRPLTLSLSPARRGEETDTLCGIPRALRRGQ